MCTLGLIGGINHSMAEFTRWLADTVMEGIRYDGAPPTLTCTTKKDANGKDVEMWQVLVRGRIKTFLFYQTCGCWL